VPIEGVPYNDSWGVIYNEAGRVVEAESKNPVLGEYTAGWIKRGPSGVIGTNKPDSVDTVEKMIIDLDAGKVLTPSMPDEQSLESFIQDRQPDYFSFADWQRLDEMEKARGEAVGRPRIKFTRIDEMIAAKNASI